MSQPAPKKAKYSQNTQKEDAYAYCTYCRKDFPIQARQALL